MSTKTGGSSPPSLPMIPVFYHPKQSVPMGTITFSPSAGKPKQVVEDWTANPAIQSSIKIQSFMPLTQKGIAQAHKRSYVAGVFNGTARNGFDFASASVAKTFLYTTGSIVAAAKHVLQKRVPVAVSPTSGFHHAGFSYGAAFCTFNGLVLAALEAKRLGLANRVLILDMDQHFGDGTEEILNLMELDFIDHITAERSYRTAEDAFMVIDTIPFSKYDLVLYQAGADMHKNDPLGGIMSTDELRKRDSAVFSRAKQSSVPIVWNLAGGYQRDGRNGISPVLEIHRNTMEECIRTFGGKDV